MLVLGALGAVMAVAFLLMADGGAPHGYGALIANELPVLIVAAGMGFGVGMLIALLWSVLQRLLAVNAPPA
jgi:hypothetical protein